MEALRKQIDDIDDALIDLLNKRTAHTDTIGRIKKLDGLALTDTDREKYIIERLATHSPLLSYEEIVKIFRAIFAVSKGRMK